MAEDVKVKNIEREEWDFNPSENMESDYKACPDDELFECFEYEYSRTWVSNGNSVKDVAQKTPFLKSFYKLCGDNFPVVPWLKIPENTRAAILKQHRKGSPSYPPLFRCGLNALDGREDGVVDAIGFGDQGLVHVTAMPFVFSWHYSNGELIEAFKQWLDENEPKATDDCKVKQPGKDERGTVRKALKALGAMRLLENGGFKRAMQHSAGKRRSQEKHPLYGKAPSWTRAKKQAESIMEAWGNPILALFARQPTLEMVLLPYQSRNNAKHRGKKALAQWMAERVPLQVARRFLTMSVETATERMSWVCRFQDDVVARSLGKAQRSENWEEMLMAESRGRSAIKLPSVPLP